MPELEQQSRARRGDVVILAAPADAKHQALLELRDAALAARERTGLEFLVIGGGVDVTVVRPAAVQRALDVLERIAKADVLDTRLAGDAEVILAVTLWQEARDAMRDLGVDVGPDGFRP